MRTRDVIFIIDPRKDNNNKYSFGKLSPYEPSEWFKIIPDTISIRNNWDMEMNNINLNEY